MNDSQWKFCQTKRVSCGQFDKEVDPKLIEPPLPLNGSLFVWVK